ncbi:hypothetical protein EKG38_09490 [Shewanella canadensis]|uniref:Uncharacterized protein n=1 Tax=Shewanella canadensis TaxID=271096 RepID=A0A431WVB3_9GAMM|nr:hypothetical protein [Shewanella canadensis]RTR39149.1 hypothetical protein EKG38_09490 [Shewanella canadensis]
MKKLYDGKRVKKQALIGWLIAMTGILLQFVLESLVWGESRPDMAAYIVGVPFAMGGLIFSHALFTILTGEERHPLDRQDENFVDIYQANMIRIRKHFKVCAVIAVVGVGLLVLFFTTHVPIFGAGFPVVMLGIFYYVFGLYRWGRCPACHHVAIDSSGRSVQLNLCQCPHCGAKLGSAKR